MLSGLPLSATEAVPLPAPPAGPLHFPASPSCAWLLVWALLVAGLLFWLGRLLWRRLARYLASRPKPATLPAPPPTSGGGVFQAIAEILERHLRDQSYRQGCHELSAVLRRHWEERGLVRPAGPRLSRLTAREIERRVGDRPATRLLAALSDLQFGRREPSRRDLEGACELAGELLVNQGEAMIEGVRFAHPWLLALLLLLIPYALFRRRQRRRRTVRFPPLQYRGGETGWRFWWQLAPQLELLVLALAVVGLAGPYVESRLDLIEDEGVDVMLVLDVSLSMLAEDLPPNRLEALRRIARDFVGRAGGNRIGIVIFAKDSYVQTPLTTDHRSLLALLDGVTVYTLDQHKSGGTSVGDALLVAAERLTRSRVEGRGQSLVVITDGESNTGIEPELAARWVRQQGIRFYAIGVGGTEPVAVSFEGRPVGSEGDYLAVLDDRRLRGVAELAGGRYYRATDVGLLERIFAELSRLESAPLELRTVASRRSYAHWPALGALALYLLHLALGGVFLRSPFR